VTLGAALRAAAADVPEHDAYVYRGSRLTYAEWNELSERVAAALVARGAVKGDRLALLLPPRPEYAIGYLGGAKAGLVTTGINPRLADPEIAFLLRDCGARFVIAIDVFAGRDYASAVARLRSELPDLQTCFGVHDASVEWRPVASAAASRAAASRSAAEPFAALLADANASERRRLGEIDASVDSGDPVAIVYTSGTTGQPKGAVFALRSLQAVARTRADMRMGRAERVLAAGTPLAHVGYMSKILGHIEDRQTTVMLDAFKARTVLETVQAERITHLGGVPTQWALLLRDADLDRFDLSSLRGGAIGGAPFTAELVRAIRSRFGIDLVTRYSATEIALGTGSRAQDDERLLAETVGRPATEVEVAIVDEGRKRLPTGEVGEVAVRSPAVMTGYWRRAAETAAVLDRDGWFYTGDLGALDEAGYLRLRGRKKEMYIRGGYNVHPVEVESWLERHPAIAQAAVVGVPDAVLGEKGLAVVVLREGVPAPAVEEVRNYCRAALADYKIPDYVEFRAELPVNAMYKVDKRELQRAWAQVES
jgi:acyl-CoA synthetase (AMP-forming)/AMP-acid ligase II